MAENGADGPQRDPSLLRRRRNAPALSVRPWQTGIFPLPAPVPVPGSQGPILPGEGGSRAPLRPGRRGECGVTRHIPGGEAGREPGRAGPGRGGGRSGDGAVRGSEAAPLCRTRRPPPRNGLRGTGGEGKGKGRLPAGRPEQGPGSLNPERSYFLFTFSPAEVIFNSVIVKK